VFVNSMSDLFLETVPDGYVTTVAKIMDIADWHTYQVLTKRAGRLRDMIEGPLREIARRSHIWWGVSVEDKKHGLPRIDQLRAAPAGVRFLSVEPLLEDLGEINLEGIHWVIVGGESGRNARPMRQEWVLSLRDQCEAAGVPFFFKQWGGVNKKRAGRSLGGRTYDAMPPRVSRAAPPRPDRLELVQQAVSIGEEWSVECSV
jgi:protein gp37